jgi:hypothetical protein
MKDERYFKTSSFQLALFLFVKKMELANIDRITDSKRATFVFIDCPEREDLLQAFNYGKEDDSSVMVDARKFITATKNLKEKLYQGVF